MCQTILTPLTYPNVEESFWTDLMCHTKDRSCPKEEYFGDMLDHLIEHNRHHGTPISNKKL